LTPVLAFIPYFAPKSFSVGPFTLSIFGLFAAAGVYLAARLLAREAELRKLDSRPLLDVALWAVLSGVVVGHLVHILFYHPEELNSFARIFEVWEGLSSFGGLIGGLLATLLFFRIRKIPLQPYADSYALSVPVGWGVARIGCFMVHDHPGVHTTFPLAVNFPGGPRHDLGLYDAILLFAIAGVIHLLAHRKLLQGRLIGVVAGIYGVFRFYFDTLRGRAGDVDYADGRYFGFTPAQYLCVALVAFAIWRLWTRPASAESKQAAEPAASRRAR
jgi:phosphatidylglycerol:prolipoprotein diacylglycerol transferase